MGALATKYAQIAHEHFMDMKFGVRHLLEPNAAEVYFFHNNPYKLRPTVADVHRAEFEEKLTGMGAKVVDYAEYPERGPDEGYSWAMIISKEGHGISNESILEAWREVFAEWPEQ